MFLFMFTVCVDSYNLTVNTNKLAVLAAREKAPIDVFKMIPFSINYLDKRVPWVTFLEPCTAGIGAYVRTENGYRLFFNPLLVCLCLLFTNI